MRKLLYKIAFVLALPATFALAQTTPNASTNPNSATPMAGQSSQSTAGDMDKSSKDQAKAGPVDEQTIIRQVKEQLATNPSFSGVNVEASKDTVTLSGDVPTKDDRIQAKNLAQAVPGVKKVRDHLKVNASAVNSVGAMGTTSNQAAAPSASGSIAGNTEAQAGVASGSAASPSAAATVGNPTGATVGEQQSTTTSSTTAIPQSDVTGSQTSTQTTGQAGTQPATSGTGAMESQASGSQSGQVQQIQQVLQQQNISNVQVVNNNNVVQLVGTVTSQEDKDKAEQLAKQAAPGITIQNNLQVSSGSATGAMNPPSATTPSAISPSSTTTPSSTTPPTSASQPPMGEATAQAGQANLPPSASSQSSTTTIPQSSASSQSSTAALPQSDVNAPQSSTSNPSSASTTGQAGSTSDLQNQIESAIKADTSVSSCNANVNVTDSQIELTGTCPTGKDRQAVKRTAQSFAANRKVVDHIKVTGKGHNEGMENMGTGSTSPSTTNPSSANPPASSGTTPPSSSYPKPPSR